MLPREDLLELLHIGRLIAAERGQQLVRPGEDVALFILRGSAKAHAATAHGDEVVTALLGRGDADGLAQTLQPGGTRATGVTALEDVAGLVVPGVNLRGACVHQPALEMSLLRVVARDLVRAEDERIRFAGSSVPRRVALRLLELAERWGRRQIDGAVEIALPLTQEELAAWCGSCRESVSKVLHTLRMAGVVDTGRRSLRIVDPHALRARCGGAETDDVAVLLAQLA